MPRKEPCCVGEPFRGEPNALHAVDCPVYHANVEALQKLGRVAPTGIAATIPRTNDRARSVGTTLIIAWDTRWCPDCSSRYFAEDAICCGQPCMPVRLEMHSREPL